MYKEIKKNITHSQGKKIVNRNNYQMAEILDIASKVVTTAIINIQITKKHILTMREYIGHFGREKKTRKNQVKILE